MMPTKTGAEYQGWTIMTNCSAGRNHRGVLLQSKFLNFLFAAEKYQHLMVKKLTYIDMVLLLCFSQKSNWWVSTFVSSQISSAQLRHKERLTLTFIGWCFVWERPDKPPPVRSAPALSLSLPVIALGFWCENNLGHCQTLAVGRPCSRAKTYEDW